MNTTGRPPIVLFCCCVMTTPPAPLVKPLPNPSNALGSAAKASSTPITRTAAPTGSPPFVTDRTALDFAKTLISSVCSPASACASTAGGSDTYTYVPDWTKYDAAPAGVGAGVGEGDGVGLGEGVGASVGARLGVAAGVPHAQASNTASTIPVARMRGTLVLAACRV